MMNEFEVVRHGPLYRASCWISVRPGSPYRAMFTSGTAIVRAWALSRERAAERCREKVKRVRADDEKIFNERESRTTRYRA